MPLMREQEGGGRRRHKSRLCTHHTTPRELPSPAQKQKCNSQDGWLSNGASGNVLPSERVAGDRRRSGTAHTLRQSTPDLLPCRSSLPLSSRHWIKTGPRSTQAGAQATPLISSRRPGAHTLHPPPYPAGRASDGPHMFALLNTITMAGMHICIHHPATHAGTHCNVPPHPPCCNPTI